METDNEVTKLTYDDRRKILNQKKTKTSENKTPEVKEDGKVTEESKLLSTVKQSLEVDYTEEGIKLAHKNLVMQKKSFEKQLIDLEKKFKVEIPKELKELQKKIVQITEFAESEKAKANHEVIKEELDKVTKELKSITDEIGSRLKF